MISSTKYHFEYLLENNKSLVLVVVPLVSLMKDQVSSLVNLVPILGTTASQSEVTNMKYDAHVIR